MLSRKKLRHDESVGTSCSGPHQSKFVKQSELELLAVWFCCNHKKCCLKFHLNQRKAESSHSSITTKNTYLLLKRVMFFETLLLVHKQRQFQCNILWNTHNRGGREWTVEWQMIVQIIEIWLRYYVQVLESIFTMKNKNKYCKTLYKKQEIIDLLISQF